MNNIKEQLQATATKYTTYIGLLVRNMRLILLIIFSIMSGYLVFRVNSLVNQEIPVASNDTKSSTDRKPDAEVLSVFNELTVQEVELESQFQYDRDNPF
jgi:hypothetical protein